MRPIDLGEPCRNFCILGSAVLTDPRDGREKVVLSTFVASGTGKLIFIDPASGKGESIAFPGDNGAWALLNVNDEKLLVGTCQKCGYLLSLDLRTRTWAEPLRHEPETYIWNLCMGSDGLVYGGSYPGCVLFRYDPAEHVLENMGKVSDVDDNLYSRQVRPAPGHIIIECGCAVPHLALWSMETRSARRFGRPGATVNEITDDFICTITDGERDFYDVRTFEPLGEDRCAGLASERHKKDPALGGQVDLAGGRALFIRGQEYGVREKPDAPLAVRPIPTPRPATHIMTVISDARGSIWGSSGFGQTIFRYEPDTGDLWNSEIVCDNGGEVYGMVFVHGRLFMSTYSGGDHVVYDPEKPWDQRGNVNPQTLESVAPGLIRPTGKSVIGPDGAFWTGWHARYGTYGGGLSRVDVHTLEVQSWYDPIPEQAIGALTADDQYLYFTTNGGASGLLPKNEPFHFVVWDPKSGVRWKKQFDAGLALTCLAPLNGDILVAVGKEIQTFDPDKMAFTGAVSVDEPCTCMVPFGEDALAAFCGNALLLLDPAAHRTTHLCELPGTVIAATVTPAGDLYFPHGTHLYKLPAGD